MTTLGIVLEIAGLVGSAAVGLLFLGLLVWLAVEEFRDARAERHRARQHAHRVAVRAERARIQRDAQAVSRRLQQQAWAMRRQMVQQVIDDQARAGRGTRRGGSRGGFHG